MFIDEDLNYKIIVFGNNSCKFCKKQIKILKNHFSKNKIVYFDLNEKNDYIDLALELKLQYIPGLVILQNNKVIFKKDGLCYIDELVYNLKNNFFVKSDFLKEFIKNKKGSIAISFEPKLVEGDYCNLQTYDNKYVIEAKLKSIKKISSLENYKTDNKTIVDFYKKNGVKSDVFLLKLIREELNGIA